MFKREVHEIETDAPNIPQQQKADSSTKQERKEKP